MRQGDGESLECTQFGDPPPERLGNLEVGSEHMFNSLFHEPERRTVRTGTAH